jgi:hypothetical protein
MRPAVAETRMKRQARRSVASSIAAGATAYDRGRHLARLISVTPEMVDDTDPEVRHAILAKLQRALRAERNRGMSGHWSYDLNRHIALKQAYDAEMRSAR